MAPLKGYKQGLALPDDDTDANYMISLGVGFLMVVPASTVAYVLIVHKGVCPPLKFKQGGLAGFCAGVFFGIGNVGAVHASSYFGMSLGYPLTETCICISGAWGIILWKEMTRGLNIRVFVASTTAIVAGSALLVTSIG
jgi:glucose uptake protein GlcU